MKRTLITLAILALASCGGGDPIEATAKPLRMPPASPDFLSATGKGTYIFSIDSGIRYNHRDFITHLVQPTQYILNPASNAQYMTGDCGNHGGHGTATTSVAAGLSWGISPGAIVVPLMAVNCIGWAKTADIVKALAWVRDSPLRPGVLNLAIVGEPNEAIDEAVRQTIAAGVTVVVPAGNGGEDACRLSPGRVPEAITVGARDGGAVASFSNYGPCVDFYLPGVDIQVAWAGADNGITMGTGTSFAAPFAVGYAARILERLPNATPAEVYQHLTTLYRGAGLHLVTK